MVGDPVFLRNYEKNENWKAGLISEMTGLVSFNVEVVSGQIVHIYTYRSGYVPSNRGEGISKHEYSSRRGYSITYSITK